LHPALRIPDGLSGKKCLRQSSARVKGAGLAATPQKAQVLCAMGKMKLDRAT
jgi:hypothetical protein